MATIVNEKGHEDFRTNMSDDHIVSVGRKALSKEELQEMVYDKYAMLIFEGISFILNLGRQAHP